MVKEGIVDRKHLINLRTKKVRATQRVFAERVGLSVDTLKSYESGRRLLTVDKFIEIKQNLGYRSSSSDSLRIMIDYLRITFKKVTDLDFFCRTYLHCPLTDFVATDTKLMKYTNLWRRGDIWIFDFADKQKTDNYQITLQLSGAGCRQFELIMERDGLTWIEVLQKMSFERTDMKVTRIDIALDEMYKGHGRESEQFDLSDLIVRTYQKQVYYDRMRSWNHIGGGSLDPGRADSGISIYYGSRQSNCYFNFYEKRFELAKKEKMTVEESLAVFEIWNRYEIRLSQEDAQSWVNEYVSGVPLEDLSKGIIVKKLDVYNGSNSYGILLPDQKWQAMFGGIEPVKLTVSPEEYSLARTVRWLIFQVSNSLRLVEEADRKMDTDYLKIILQSGELTDEAKEIIAQLSPADSAYLREQLGVSESYG